MRHSDHSQEFDANTSPQPIMFEPSLFDILHTSTFPLPALPRLKNGKSWDTVFMHESLPSSNLVLATLGSGIFRSCVSEWLIDGDTNVTRPELQVRLEERTHEDLVAAFSDVYSLPLQLMYAKDISEHERYTIEDRARVFEAYVGGLHRDQGYAIVKEWIYALMDWDNLTMLKMLHEGTPSLSIWHS